MFARSTYHCGIDSHPSRVKILQCEYILSNISIRRWARYFNSQFNNLLYVLVKMVFSKIK